MAPHPLRPRDIPLLRWATQPDLSADGRRVAWCEISLDTDKDEPVSEIMVAEADGKDGPRSFSPGPHDSSPSWSPDGRHLAYVSAGETGMELKLAPLDGGAPVSIETPGTVLGAEWSPDGHSLALVVRVTGDGNAKNAKDAKNAKNAPRVVRGLKNRLDGAGYFEGRAHLFLYDLERAELRQLTDGRYDETEPSWSPDGKTLVFVSNRTARRDDSIFGDGLWTMSVTGGRLRRVGREVVGPSFPTFSPDGSRIACVGMIGGRRIAGRDQHVLVVPSDGTGEATRLAPETDLPTGFSFMGRAFAWLSDEELVFTLVERGTVGLARATLGQSRVERVVRGDLQISQLALPPGGGGRCAYSSSWVDSVSEISVVDLGRRRPRPVRLSRAGARLGESVELQPAERFEARGKDGLRLEYFVIRPPAGGGKSRRLSPIVLEVHGGPHLYNPMAEDFVHYQCLAAAGYLVVLPNPRGSIGYGESVTAMVTGDWGGADSDDLLVCLDDAIERQLGDGRRQAVTGYSYGGFMSSWLIGRTNRFFAACIGAPVVDAVSQFGTWDGVDYFADEMGADPWSPEGELRARSPLSYLPQVTTPVFLYVHEGDLRCPPSQSDELFAGLKWLGKEVEYVRYPGGSHLSVLALLAPPSQSVDRAERILSFLDRHRRPGSRVATRPVRSGQ